MDKEVEEGTPSPLFEPRKINEEDTSIEEMPQVIESKNTFHAIGMMSMTDASGTHDDTL